MSDAAINALLARLEKVTQRLESVEKQLATGGGSAPSGASSQQSSGSSGEDSPSVQAYEALINQYINNYVALSSKLNAPEVVEQAALVLQAVNAQRDFLRVAATSKKPSQDVLNKLIAPTSDLMGKITALRDAKRSSKFFNNLSAISEGISALGWVVVSPTPGPHVADSRGSSEFYSNRILKEFKGNDQTQVDWANAYNTFLKELQAYIKQFHTTGLTWNPKGGDAPSTIPASSSTPSSGGAPPPPALPPVFVPDANANAAPAKKADTSALFSALNAGGDITKGLKKVTSDMKNKNRTDISSVVPADAIKEKETKAPATGKPAVVKPPKFALEGMKWCVENQVNNKSIVIEETEPKQTCYIYKCKGSVVQIKGKINAVVLDGCEKTAVVFENLVATCDVVNCTSVEVQVTGKVPSISVDKTSGCQLYIGKDALSTEIYTSKSSEMNVLIPPKVEGDDLIEIAVPEQYRTIIKDFKLVTECTSHV